MENRKRIIGIDYFRALMILLILIYHIWVTTGRTDVFGQVVTLFISLGGEIGVTGFFALSGFGIYRCILVQDEKKQLTFMSFLKKRLEKLYPAYFICLLFSVLFMDGAYYLTKDEMLNIATHLFFLHNIKPSFAGGINGVLWTMAVIVQFYIIAIPMYKYIKKGKGIAVCSIVLLNILIKYLIYQHVLGCNPDMSMLYFYAGRMILPSVIDNFAVGMYVAHLVYERDSTLNVHLGRSFVCVSVILLYIVSVMGTRNGIHTNNWSGYVWHSCVALALFIQMMGFTTVKFNSKKLINKVLITVSDNEYGIYLWHLLLINNIVSKTAIVSYMTKRGGTLVCYAALVTLSCLVGKFSTKHLEKF